MKSPPSSAASLAATQAFLANRNSNADLSNAAAAAALRSHTTSPTPVGQIQTKRMQRKNSLSSNGTDSDRPGLQRRGSGGSLTERTFRDAPSPAPKRPASTQGTYARYEQPPPVPALPRGYAAPMPIPQMAARRAASVEPPERVVSPPPRLPGGRGASLDRGPGHMKSNQGGSKPRLSSLETVGELDRSGSRASINFSRPISPQNSSPTSPLVAGRVRSPPPTQPTGVGSLPNAEVNRILGSIQETAAAPVKRKKKVVAKASSEGSHLATGTSSGAAQVATSKATPQQRTGQGLPTPPPSDAGSQAGGINEAPKPKKKKKKTIPATNSQTQEASEGFGNAYPSDTDSVTSELSSTTDRPRTYNTRAAGLLMKQPSIVREDREAEEQEDRRVPGKKAGGQATQNGAVGASTPANTSKVVSKGPQHNRSVSQADTPNGPKRTSLDVPGAGSPQSISPVRAAHFSSQPEYETPGSTRHQPPGRSVSPAKSALKHSPSRGASPIAGRPAGRRTSLNPGEASDTASNISDGSKSAPMKKKSARVSFDDDSVAVGRAASPPMTPESPALQSPQNTTKGRSWFDLVRDSKKQEGAVVDLEEDSIIKPTPALPSFGSVRGRDEEATLEAQNKPRTSEDWAQDTLRSMDTSTDHVVGSIISQDAAAREKIAQRGPILQSGYKDPLPPQVTSVEGSGYHSDDEPALSDEGKGSAKEASEEPDPSVPAIALQPATPALENSGQDRNGWLGMPGGFPGSSENSEIVKASKAPAVEHHVEHHSPVITPATVGLAEPEPEAAAHQHDPGSPHVGEVAEGLRTQIEAQAGEESEDTGESVYSDAAEDVDDLDGDGFGSINAIVESPASPLLPLATRSPPASPSFKAPIASVSTPPTAIPPTAKAHPTRSPLGRSASEQSEPGSDEGWDRAQAYWSGLSQTRKQQLEQAAVPGAIDEPVLPNKTMRGQDSVKKKAKKSPRKSSPPPLGDSVAVLPDWQDKQYQNKSIRATSPQATPLKSSMRKSPPETAQEAPMRSSMRGGPSKKPAVKNSTQRTSMQPSAEPRGALQKQSRPVSAVAMVDYNKPQVAHTRAASAGLPSTALTPVAPQIKKTKSAVKPSVFRNDSDSSSSFKKERRSTSSAGKYNMKRTMRPQSMDAGSQSRQTTGSLSARTSSPAGSAARRPFSSVGPGGGAMRTSMRGSTDSGKPARTSLRGASMDEKRPKSPSRFGFGKSKAKLIEPQGHSRFPSRFGDSSDDEDYTRPAASSRFADSSDEDEPTKLTPVRGIPRRINEGDSTDLEDSSTENVPAPSKAMMNGIKLVPINTKPEGAALATGSLRVASGEDPTAAMGSGLQAKKAAEKKKRSFFGALGSRKKSDDPTRVRKSDIESAARRDTPLERSKAERMMGTGSPKTNERVLGPSSPTADSAPQGRPLPGSRTSSAQNSPKSPKLQRRNTPKKITMANDISWPLPQGTGGIQSAPDSRPQTSDGHAADIRTSMRPNIGRVQSESGPPRTAPLVVGKTEKKKRFGMLRKAFGLHD